MSKITAINGFIKKTTGCVKRKLTPRILPNYIGNVNDASGFIFIKKNNFSLDFQRNSPLTLQFVFSHFWWCSGAS